MNPNRSNLRGFTLIELILVMVILTIVVGAIAPLLRGFAAGRRTADSARMILALAQYAHTQAQAEGRTYRLNFDDSAGTFWLTADHDDGTFQPPTNDFGKTQKLYPGVTMQVDITPPVVPLDQQQSATPTSPQPTLPGAYVEFDPGGRSQPVKISLKDNFGSTVQLACASETDELRILSPQEMTR
ncbi:MAG: GspH/FimT family pseudopilin [Tepidisphaeraceae bacterium]|jgi:type II secretion system protein H